MTRYKLTLYINDEEKAMTNAEWGELFDNVDKTLFEGQILDDWEWEEVKE